MRKTTLILAALSLTLAACSNAESEETSTSSSLSTTTTEAETTTSEPTTTTSDSGSEFTSPINGTDVDDAELLDRRVLAVKVDNHPNARPQSGINNADMMIEVLVEGVTRFISVWHHSDADYLGPMRSGRPTDASILPAFGEPTFSISGAQSWVQSLIRSKGINLTGEVRPATFRISGRRAPHNLYVNTNLLREYSNERGNSDEGPTEPIWEFGELPSGGTDLESVNFNFSGNSVTWTWDDAQGAWLRSASGSDSNYRDEDGTTERLAFPVMVAMNVEQYTASPSSGGSGLPSSRTIGSGTAYVFANGQVVEGTWEREEETDWFTITDQTGSVIPIPVGQIWISMVPGSGGVTLTPAG